MSITKTYSCNVKLKSKKDGKKVFTAIANSLVKDRDNEIVLPKGAMLDEYYKNPVMANAHAFWMPSVGKVHEIRVSDDRMEFDFDFAPTQDGQDYEKLYEGGYQRAFSVSFIPAEDGITEVDGGVKEIAVELPNGGKQTIDLTKYEGVERIISKWELLEISPVLIGANQEALLTEGKTYTDIAKNFVAKSFNKENEFAKNILENINSYIDQYEKAMEHQNVTTIHKVAGFDVSDISDMDMASSMAKHALKDKKAGFEKTNIDWSKYALGFVYYDADKSENFKSYKYPHHIVNDKGELIVNIPAVEKAIENVKADDNLDAGAKEIALAHLEQHLADAKETDIYREYKAKQNTSDNDNSDGAVDSNNKNYGAYVEKLEKALDDMQEMMAELKIKMSLTFDFVSALYEDAQSNKTIADDNSGDDGDYNEDLVAQKLQELAKELNDVFKTEK